MRDLGDRSSGVTIDFKFKSVDDTGVGTTLGGSPVVSVYKGNSAVEATTGVTLTVDFDGHTGLNHVRVATSDAFYEEGFDYEIVITAGTVDSKSAVGEVVGHFSLANRLMRGTDDALPAASAPSNFSSLGINGSGHVERVVLNDTTTANSDMRGTDGANTTTPPTAEENRVEMDSNSTKLTNILDDTNELQTDDVPGLIAAMKNRTLPRVAF